MARDFKYTFSNSDIFKRKRFADNLVNVISKSEHFRDESFVIAIDSAWGTGKTIFLEQFEQEIKLSEEELYVNLNATVIRYNAWINDDWDDAFVPIAYHLFQQFKDDIIKMGLKEELINDFKEIVYSIGKNLLEGYLNSKGITEETMGFIKKAFNRNREIEDKSMEVDFFKAYEQNTALKNKLKKILLEISKGYGHEHKLIIIIDELDRCKPTYAIQTLEVVKHFFGIENVIFILGIDMEQLSHSVSTVYGQNMDSSGYLRRFVDLIFRLPLVELDPYIRERTQMKIEDSKIVQNAIKFYNPSVRDIVKITNSIYFFYLSQMPVDNAEKRSQFRIYVYLICLKHYYPKEYKEILSDNFCRKSEISSHENNTRVVIDNKILPKEIWEKSIYGLSSGRNMKKISELIDIDSETLIGTNIDHLINIAEVKKYNLYNLTLGQYIDRKIEVMPNQN